MNKVLGIIYILILSLPVLIAVGLAIVTVLERKGKDDRL